jgi:mono/diheme cytochrome c family protein
MKRSALILALFLASGAAISQAADVKENWQKHCGKCHGADGKGETSMGKKMKVKDYTSAKVQEEMKDDDMAKIIKEGKKEGSKTLMKAFPELNDAEITALVKYVRAFKK